MMQRAVSRGKWDFGRIESPRWFGVESARKVAAGAAGRALPDMAVVDERRSRPAPNSIV